MISFLWPNWPPLLKRARRRVTNLRLANQAGRRRQSLEYLRARNTREFRYSRENRLTLRWNWTDHPYPGCLLCIHSQALLSTRILYWSRIVDREISLSSFPLSASSFSLMSTIPLEPTTIALTIVTRPNSNRLSSFTISQQDSVGEFLQKDPLIFYRSKNPFSSLPATYVPDDDTMPLCSKHDSSSSTIFILANTWTYPSVDRHLHCEILGMDMETIL